MYTLLYTSQVATIIKNGLKWRAIIRRRGHKTTSKTFPKKALAERWARQEEERIASMVVSPAAEQTTVRALLALYKEKFTPRKRSANREASRIWILCDALGDLSMARLSAEDVIDYVDDRLDSVVSDTVRKEINTLSIAIDAGMAIWGIKLPANPVKTAKGVLKVTKTLTPGHRRERRPTADELALLYGHAPGVMPGLIEFAIETAMRRGEIAAIRPEHARGHYLLIPETKIGTPRRIPLTDRAEILLASVFGNWGMRPDSISQAFNRACDKCGIVGLRFHDLRHEAASRMIEHGLSIAEVAAITGQTFATLQRYTHLSPQHMAKAVRW